MTRLLALAALALTTPAHAGDATSVMTGCHQGDVDRYAYDLPAQTFGDVPDKVLDVTLALARGDYTVQIVSEQPFEPFVYTRGNGDWRYAGIARVSMQRTDGLWTMQFDVRQSRQLSDSHWRLQIKPRGAAQTTRHRLQVVVNHQTCPSTRPNPPTQSCRCPAGSKTDDGIFGTGSGDCIDQTTGAVVPMVCG